MQFFSRLALFYSRLFRRQWFVLVGRQELNGALLVRYDRPSIVVVAKQFEPVVSVEIERHGVVEPDNWAALDREAYELTQDRVVELVFEVSLDRIPVDG